MKNLCLCPGDRGAGEGWLVEDVEKATEELQARGIVFEQYDMPGLKTDDRGITVRGPAKSAWFKDSTDNILAITEVRA